MKKIRPFVFLAAVAMLAGFYSCDAIEKASTQQVSISGKSFVIPVAVAATPGAQTKTPALIPFSGQTTINTGSGAFSGMDDYLNAVKKVTINEVEISATTTGSGTTVQNLVFSSQALGMSTTPMSYDFGDVTVSPGLAAFAQAVVASVFKGNDVDVKVEGETDEPSAANLSFTFTIEDGSITVQLIEF